MANIALVNCNVTQPAIAPLGLEYLAEACREAGVVAEVIDLCFAADPAAAVQQRLAQCQPELVGVTFRNTDNCYLLSSHSFLPELTALVAAIRSTVSAPIVIGGAGFSVAPGAIMKAVGADYGVIGDGEQAVPLLLRALRHEMDHREVPGLLWWENGDLHSNTPAWPDLSGQLGLRRDTVDNASYFQRGGQLGLETKRGCDRDCVYCADPLSKGRRLRLRSPAAVAEEMACLLDQGGDVYHLCDSEFNLPERHARAVCQELIARGLGARVRWYAYLAPAPFAAELADLMQRAGCAGINFGADSGSNQMLARLGRDFTSAEVIETVSLCRQRDMPVMLDLLIGAPGETRQTVIETIALAKAAGPSCVGIALGVRIYAGTPLAHLIAAEGPLEKNAAIHGQTKGNESFLAPVFYLSPELGSPSEATGLLTEMIAGDQRFFFGGSSDDRDYDYDNNETLITAIAAGAQGAYWDILRQIPGRGQTGTDTAPLTPVY